MIEKEGEDPHKYALHSLRAGGATLAAQKGIAHADIQRHGRWKDPQSLATYINPSAEQKYAVTRTIFGGEKEGHIKAEKECTEKRRENERTTHMKEIKELLKIKRKR